MRLAYSGLVRRNASFSVTGSVYRRDPAGKVSPFLLWPHNAHADAPVNKNTLRVLSKFAAIHSDVSAVAVSAYFKLTAGKYRPRSSRVHQSFAPQCVKW